MQGSHGLEPWKPASRALFLLSFIRMQLVNNNGFSEGGALLMGLYAWILLKGVLGALLGSLGFILLCQWKLLVLIFANWLDVDGTRNTVDNDAELASKHTALQCTSQLAHFMMLWNSIQTTLGLLYPIFGTYYLILWDYEFVDRD